MRVCLYTAYAVDFNMLIYTAFDARYNDLSDPATVDLTAAVCNGVSHSQATIFSTIQPLGDRKPPLTQMIYLSLQFGKIGNGKESTKQISVSASSSG